MRFQYFVLFVLAVLVSCQSDSDSTGTTTSNAVEETEKPEVTPGQNIIDFHSQLRPEKQDWNESNTYTDTLEFRGINTDYDYAFANFQMKNGKEVTFYGAENVNAYYQNRNMVVEWGLDTYAEAGEEDALYFKETIHQVRILETSMSFEAFLEEFTDTYQTKGSAAVSSSIHPDVELMTAYNPGAYCMRYDREITEQMTFPEGKLKIEQGLPQGDFCEGYAGYVDGLYYQFIDETQLPGYAVFDESGEVSEKGLYIEPAVEYGYFAKVLVVKNEGFDRYLYFFNGNNKWYFWVEDLCDCSA